MNWDTVIADLLSDGQIFQASDRTGATETLQRYRTEKVVPVPSLIDALGQHKVAAVTRRAGFISHPAYHPEAQ